MKLGLKRKAINEKNNKKEINLRIIIIENKSNKSNQDNDVEMNKNIQKTKMKTGDKRKQINKG